MTKASETRKRNARLREIRELSTLPDPARSMLIDQLEHVLLMQARWRAMELAGKLRGTEAARAYSQSIGAVQRLLRKLGVMDKPDKKKSKKSFLPKRGGAAKRPTR